MPREDVDEDVDQVVEPVRPEGLGAAGGALWDRVVEANDLGGHEVALLGEACWTLDALTALQATVTAEGATVASYDGPTRPHPNLVELRQQRLVLARLLASLRIPDEEGDRPQRRGAARGAYGERGDW